MEYTVLNYFFENFKLFFLILIRISSLYFVAPFFSEENFPMLIKAGFAFFTALVIFPLVAYDMPLYSDATTLGYAYNVINQVIIGIIIGLFARIFFTIIQISGQYYTIQLGFGMINTLDPFSRAQISILGTFEGLIGLMLFLYVRGHHFLIVSIVKSFDLFPLFNTKLLSYTNETLTFAITKMFYLGFMFAMPIIGLVFIITLLLGILAKVAPQMNLLMVGFPIKILGGLLMLIVLQGLLLEVMKDIFLYMMDFINRFIEFSINYV